jgi:LysM repeat protein
MLKSRAFKFISVSFLAATAVAGSAAASFADSSSTYTVKSGDTLFKIAASHGTTWERLQDINHFSNPDLIYPGEVVQLTGSSGSSSPAPIVNTEQSVSPAPAHTSAVKSVPPVSSSVNWDAVAQCESSGNWSINTGNGFYGGLQFTKSTWDAYGGDQYAAYPNEASQAAQETVANAVLAGQGIGAWPVCGSLG